MENSVLLITLRKPGEDERSAFLRSAEIRSLISTLGLNIIYAIEFTIKERMNTTYIGKGQAETVKEAVLAYSPDEVIIDAFITPREENNLERIFGVPVSDREAVILAIFFQNARSREARLQIEKAEAEYLRPRLADREAKLSQQRGGVRGAKGEGERKIELERRRISERIRALDREIKATADVRKTQRKSRERSGIFSFALLGYTNAGKSTILNALTGSEVLAEDKLFATLDPTARKLTLPSGLNVIAVDTVGFVSRLPHKLVEAFKSTLEEAAYSDVIVKVADAADEEREEQLTVTDQVLAELGCEGIPQLTVYNKCDKAGATPFDPAVILTSAKTGQGLDDLLAALDAALSDRVRAVKLVLPYDKLGLAEAMRSRGSVSVEDYRENGVYFEGFVKSSDLHIYLPYLLEN